MTCPACTLPLAPGAYCDGNGTHPPRRAKRLSREEAAEARRLAAERERARHAARVADEDRKERHRGLENPLRRRWQAQRGLLAAELSAAVADGLVTQEEADAWAAETAGRLARERQEQEAREAEAAATGERGHCAKCNDRDGLLCTEWLDDRLVSPKGCVCPCHIRELREREPTPGQSQDSRAEPSPEPRRRPSHRGALFTAALVGALMGVGGLGDDRP